MNSILKISLSKTELFLSRVLTHRDYLDSETIVSIYEAVGDDQLYRICEANKITSIAADALMQCSDINDLGDHWVSAYQRVDSTINQYMRALEDVASLLQSHNIQLVALKNSGITKALYPYYGSCPMGDLDVLVRKSDFRSAHRILTDFGYVLKFRSPLEEENIDSAERSGGAEYHLTLSDGSDLWFELQWRSVAGRWIRPDQEPSTDDLLDRSLPIEGSSVRILSAEDNLLQVALHTAKHSYVRAPGFRLHTDVDRIVRTMNIDWEVFISSVERLQVKTATFLSLALAHDLLGSPIPEGVMERIKPPKWKVKLLVGWLSRVGLFDPEGKKWGRVGYIIFVSLLYDDFGGFARGVIPSASWIAERYDVRFRCLLPFFYVRYLMSLAIKRTIVQ